MSRVPNIFSNGPGNRPDADLVMANFDWLTNTPASGTLTLGGVISVSSAGAVTIAAGITITGATVTQSISTAGTTAALGVTNSDNTNAASHAQFTLQTGGASGGDPFIRFYNAVTNWAIGLDNSDVDAFIISEGSSLGTSNRLRMISGGQLQMSSGSVSAPQYSFISDPDSGMYSNGANQIALAVGGAQVFFASASEIDLLASQTNFLQFDASIPQFNPRPDNVWSLGRGTGTPFRWTAVWATNGTIQTSHSDFKRDIENLAELHIPRGVTYRWKDREGRTDDHLFIGFLADDLPPNAFDKNADGSINKLGVHTNAVLGELCAGWHNHERRIAWLESELARLAAA